MSTITRRAAFAYMPAVNSYGDAFFVVSILCVAERRLAFILQAWIPRPVLEQGLQARAASKASSRHEWRIYTCAGLPGRQIKLYYRNRSKCHQNYVVPNLEFLYVEISEIFADSDPSLCSRVTACAHSHHRAVKTAARATNDRL